MFYNRKFLVYFIKPCEIQLNEDNMNDLNMNDKITTQKTYYKKKKKKKYET